MGRHIHVTVDEMTALVESIYHGVTRTHAHDDLRRLRAGDYSRGRSVSMNIPSPNTHDRACFADDPHCVLSFQCDGRE